MTNYRLTRYEESNIHTLELYCRKVIGQKDKKLFTKFILNDTAFSELAEHCLLFFKNCKLHSFEISTLEKQYTILKFAEMMLLGNVRVMQTMAEMKNLGNKSATIRATPFKDINEFIETIKQNSIVKNNNYIFPYVYSENYTFIGAYIINGLY